MWRSRSDGENCEVASEWLDPLGRDEVRAMEAEAGSNGVRTPWR